MLRKRAAVTCHLIAVVMLPLLKGVGKMKVKICMYCKGDKYEIKQSLVINGVYIQCANCDHSSASAKTKEIAIQDWNEHN